MPTRESTGYPSEGWRARWHEQERLEAQEARTMGTAGDNQRLDEKGIHPDWVMHELQGTYMCIDEVTFKWDQWTAATIKCDHGSYRGVSDGFFNPMGQSLWRAYQQFIKDEDEHDKEEE